MPLSREKMAEYQRARRAQAKTDKTPARANSASLQSGPANEGQATEVSVAMEPPGDDTRRVGQAPASGGTVQRRAAAVERRPSSGRGEATSRPPRRAQAATRLGRRFAEIHAGVSHVHEWRRDDLEVICDDCGEVVPWKGKLLPRYTDGLPEWPQLVQTLSAKSIDKILSRINTKGARG